MQSACTFHRFELRVIRSRESEMTDKAKRIDENRFGAVGLVLCSFVFIGLATYSLIDGILENNTLLYFSAIFIAVLALAMFLSGLDLYAKHLFEKPKQFTPQQLLFDVSGTIEQEFPSDVTGVEAEPVLRIALLLPENLSFLLKIRHLEREKQEAYRKGIPFRGRIIFCFVRYLIEQDPMTERVVPLSVHEMTRIQQKILRGFIASSSLTPVQLKLTESRYVRPGPLADERNKYYIELIVS
jgi:hypothetical protein